ncbi:hypothetical protein BZA77DRAFT_317811 [Pyronema omphalodes]|nr:hypothetical protein BZA77DRAFT_317811 [Pyronema omphalodes]
MTYRFPSCTTRRSFFIFILFFSFPFFLFFLRLCHLTILTIQKAARRQKKKRRRHRQSFQQKPACSSNFGSVLLLLLHNATDSLLALHLTCCLLCSALLTRLAPALLPLKKQSKLLLPRSSFSSFSHLRTTPVRRCASSRSLPLSFPLLH